MSEPTHSAPVSGTCTRCGCKLGYAASREAQEWFCCGPCSGSDRCHCGCKPEYANEVAGDVYVPTRRMFAARHPDELRTKDEGFDRARAFPFSDKPRGQ
ncbi:MAG TPA: hypothetical protein VMR31_10735 [Myxococcota bacterium]|nr:hypothetical protein [Myxococcota bacterium]